MNIQLQLITKLFLSSFLFLEAREKKLFKKWEDVEKKKTSPSYLIMKTVEKTELVAVECSREIFRPKASLPNVTPPLESSIDLTVR